MKQQNESIYASFWLQNSLLLLGLMAAYAQLFSWQEVRFYDVVFVLSSLVSHSMLLASPILLLGWVLGQRLQLKQQRVLMAALSTVVAVLMLIDLGVYSNYHFHLSGFVWKFLWYGEAIKLPGFFWVLVLAAFGLGTWLHYLLNRWLGGFSRLKPWSVKALILGVMLLFTSHFMHAYGAALGLAHVRLFPGYLPLFYPLTAEKFLLRTGWVDQALLAQQRQLKVSVSSHLNYPHKSISAPWLPKPPNLLFVMIDAWRYDALTAAKTPHIHSFIQQHQHVSFNQHYSAGNATRTGMFGLFYSLYPHYWQSVLATQKQPVLISHLQKLGYEFGIFASSQLEYPEFSRTIFTGIPGLRIRTAGDSTVQRDAKATAEWLAWFQDRDVNQPYLSLLFYDAAHAYEAPKAYASVADDFNMVRARSMGDPLPIMHRYLAGVRYIDDLLAPVFAALDASGAMENTLVIVTSDHGEEINDFGNNMWGHGSRFSQPQLHVPLVLVGAGTAQLKDKHQPELRTSHLDLVPTLMRHYFQVQNPVQDYSQGLDMLGSQIAKRRALVVGRYGGYGLVFPNYTLDIANVGDYQTYNTQSEIMQDQGLDMSEVQSYLHRSGSMFVH
jgi:membrane-anchored protein YejM (alkaline phosphatase superfamily)